MDLSDLNPLSWIGKLVVKPIADTVGSYNAGKARITEAKIGAEVAKYEAQAARWKREDNAESSWDNEALKQSQYSWKDEFIMLIWLAPFIMLFIPPLQPYAVKGFNSLATVPYGYWLVIFGIVAQSFGLRWLFKGKMDKAIKTIKEGVSTNV